MQMFRQLFLALFLLASVSSVKAQVSFDQDSVSLTYARCLGESSLRTALIINHSSQDVILDVKFLDSMYSRTWYFVTEDQQMVIEGDTLAAGATIKFDIIHQGGGEAFSSDTLALIHGGKSDTLFLNATIVRPMLTYAGNRVDAGVVGVGATKKIERTIANVGEIPFPVNSIDPSSDVWTISGIAVGDTILPGEVRNITFDLAPQTTTRSVSTAIHLSSGCGTVTYILDVKIANPGLHWNRIALVDTVRGCARPTEYTVDVTNTGTTEMLLDSVGFTKGYDYLWSIVGSPKSIVIGPGSTFPVKFRRETLGGFSFFVTYTAAGTPDTLPVRIFMETARPELKNTTDTVIFKRTTDQPVNYFATLENEGEVKYRITSLTYSGSELWSMEMPDAVTELARNRNTELRATFAGSTTPGEYAMTYKVQGTVCDTILTQTVIVKVTMADVAEEVKARQVQLYPSVATTGVTLRAEGPMEFTIIDVLGNELLSGRSDGPDANINVTPLTQGTYYARIVAGGLVTTIPFVVNR